MRSPALAAVVGVAGVGTTIVVSTRRPPPLLDTNGPKSPVYKRPPVVPWQKTPCPDGGKMREDLPVLAEIRKELHEEDVKRSQFYQRGTPYGTTMGSLRGRGQ